MEHKNNKKFIIIISVLLFFFIVGQFDNNVENTGGQNNVPNQKGMQEETQQNKMSENDEITDNTKNNQNVDLNVYNSNESIDSNLKKTINISKDEYAYMLNDELKIIFEDNQYYKLSAIRFNRLPYVEIDIYPKYDLDQYIANEQAKILTEKILIALKKYDYKEGGFFRANWDIINIYFNKYEKNGSLNRTGNFTQIEILKINGLTVDDIFKK